MEKNVFIVTCYQNVIGVYETMEDATQVADSFIKKGRIADVICRPVINSKMKKNG